MSADEELEAMGTPLQAQTGTHRTSPPRSTAAKTGLVLSGGGARGAYEAGVLRYIRTQLPPKVRARARFEVVCGTSVGAINACFVAASAHDMVAQGDALADVWERLRIDGVYQVGLRELMNLPRFLLGSRGRGSPDDVVGSRRLGGLLNTAPLEQLVRRGTQWHRIQQNLDEGHLHALCINATHLSSGTVHSFVQLNGESPRWSSDASLQLKRVKIGPEHALASSAIPWIFPCVDIDGQVYADGGLKLNTPISPAIRLGADRLLVIGLRAKSELTPSSEPDAVDQSPSAGFLLGKIFNALLSDKTELDLQRVERFNNLIEAGERAYGAGFSSSMERAMQQQKSHSYRKVETLFVQPHENMGEIAAEHLRMGSVVSRAGPVVGPLLLRAAGSGINEGDLLSYLLFDGEYARDLVAMGMRDADAMRQRLIEFFSV
jgi:NTE family protein